VTELAQHSPEVQDMGSNAGTWQLILHYWPITLFVPAILALIALLALLTRMVDR
jgi:hypothetical protein